MRLTSVLRQQASKLRYNSLALTVTFKHPDFNMKDYELLSRGSAFLLSVDGPMSKPNDGAYSNLETEEYLRKMKAFQREKGYTPANPGGDMKDLSWLEFVPREHRPNVHIVASSHVLSPFLWKDYYPQEWLSYVRKEHCRYALEVYDEPGKPLATFDLADTQPFHHPEGRDVALVHFPNEEEMLPKLRKLGVQTLHLRENDNLYEKGETMTFDGYAIPGTDPLKSSQSEKENNDSTNEQEEQQQYAAQEDDNRLFSPYKDSGNLSFHTDDRFFAHTPTPLPEGLCGAPALDKDGRCCGVVEGIVPLHSEHKALAGHAAFMPHFYIAAFVDLVERQMLRTMMDEDLYQMVVTAKKTNTIGGGVFKMKNDGSADPNNVSSFQEANDIMMEKVRKQCSKEEFDAMKAVFAHERKEIERILREEGGDMGEIAKRVRAQTLAMRDMVHEKYRQSQEKRKSS